ncbi:MAG: nucleotidyl transferase AbiEii/AbiGii toxin family protein, partial [Clostridia bacterium]|nr:nucleotidyl transferase AbiEii/AbiGii toxin family protein [Clostridia bacterium]
ILFPSNDIKPYLKVEMVFIQKAFPDEIKPADSYIGSWLINNGNSDAAEQFDLLPFQIRVQSLERTLVDKVFALCDYYLRDEESRNSRHIYDISRILTKVKINDELKTLVESVREVRKPNKTSLSAQDGVDVPELLKKIVDSGFFKKDYENSTEKLLIKPVSYGDAIKSLETIIDSGLFANNKKTPVDDEYAPPSVIYERRKAERRAKIMEGRGPETLVGLVNISVFEDAKAHYIEHGIEIFENLYYGDQVYDSEEENERKLMELLAPFCGGDRERLITVFKSSGQYNKDKPYDYYDKMADACLKDIADMSEKTKSGKDIKQSDFSSKKDTNSGNSK